MKKLKFALFFSVLTLFTSCIKEPSTLSEGKSVDSKEEMDAYIFETLKKTDEPFDWNKVSDEMLFKALKYSNMTMVVGYSDGVNTDLSLKNKLMDNITEIVNAHSDAKLKQADIFPYRDDELGFFNVKISNQKMVSEIRKLPGITFTQVSEYVVDEKYLGEFDYSYGGNPAARTSNGMILDPFNEEIDYLTQVNNYESSYYTIIKRHNMEKVYLDHKIFGEGVAMAVLDNGIVDWAYDLFLNNGYGARNALGFYTPDFLNPNAQPDGISPQPTDAFGIAALFEAQVLHGSGMIRSMVILAPNADITIVRASTAIIILFQDQIVSLVKAIKAMANDSEIRLVSMSMGTFFNDGRIANAINLYYSKGKLMTCAAGTSFKEIKKSLGIIFPASLPTTVSVTGISNREDTGGEFVASETAHFGRRNDFCVERSAASSEATSRFAGMLTLIWSANPQLTREQVLDIAIKSSYFYQNNNGKKDPKFGWGTIDVTQAVEMALATK